MEKYPEMMTEKFSELLKAIKFQMHDFWQAQSKYLKEYLGDSLFSDTLLHPSARWTGL